MADYDPGGGNSVPFGPQGDTPAPAYDPGGAARPSILSTSHAELPRDANGGAGIPWDDQARGFGLGARDVITGLASLPAAALDVATWLPRVGIRAVGGTATAPSDMLQRGLTALGLPEPETPGEKTRSEVFRGGASMLTPIGLANAAPGFVARIPSMIRPLIAPSAPVTSAPLAATQVAAGGVGAGAGEMAASSDLVPDALKPTVQMAGNVAGATLTGKINDAVGKLWNMSQGYQTPIAQALERLRIFPRTAGAVTENPDTRVLEAGATKAPFSAGVLQPAQRDTSGQFHAAVEETARLLGPEATKQEAGGSVQQILQDWHANTFPTEQTAIWAPLNQRMAGAAVDPSAYRTALEDMANPPALAGLTETQRAFGSGQARQWLEALNADRPPGQNISWEQAQAIRTQIGQAMGTPDIISSLGMDRLRRLYAGLAQGMNDTAQAHGQAGQFRLANQSTIDAHNFIDNTVVKAITARNPGQETKAPDAAATALLNSNSAMQDLRDRVPAAADALGAYQLRRAAMAQPNQQGATDTPSAGSFLTTIRRQQLDRPEGTAALYSDPAVDRALHDLLTVAGNVKETERLMNTSNTAGAMQVGQTVTAPVRWPMAYHYGGGLGLAGAIGTDVAPWLTAKALTSRLGIRYAGTPPGPRLPLDPKVAGLLGYLSGQ